MGNLNKTTAEVEALLDKASDSAIAPYIIRSFYLQMLTDTSGEVGVMRAELYGGLISDAIREGRRVLLVVGSTKNGCEGWVDTNAYQEDLIYLDFYHMEHLYHIEIDSSSATYTKQYISDYVRDVAATVVEESMPTEIATATQKIDARDLRLTTLEPNIMYDWSGSSLVSLTIPRLSRAQAGYEHKWMVRLTCGNSSQVTIPFTVTWLNGVAPSWSTWSTVEFTFTKGNDGSVIYGEYKIFR